MESRGAEKKGLSRRELLGVACACCASWPAFAKEKGPAAQRPKKGDLLVFAGGDRVGEAIATTDIPARGTVVALPRDPESGVVRDGSRLNRVLLLRTDPDSLSSRTAEGAVSGVLAYSSVCTHTGCNIDERLSEAGLLVCPCHGSEFDPRDRAKVMGGPAPRRLAQLPLKVVEGRLVVRRGFSGRVGFTPL